MAHYFQYRAFFVLRCADWHGSLNPQPPRHGSKPNGKNE